MEIPSENVLVEQLIERWHNIRMWAEQLICETFGLKCAAEILERPEIPRYGSFGESDWEYMVHGVGINISKRNNQGGIDFDFNKPLPDQDRLREFMIKQVNAGSVARRHYRPLLQDADRWAKATNAVLETSGP